MKLEVQSNALIVLQQVEHVAIGIPRGLEAAVEDVSKAMLLATTSAMEELIYAQPLPASYARYGVDDRSGALLAGEARVIVNPTEQLITTENTGMGGKDPTRYAEWRHDYQNLPAPWRTAGLEEVTPAIPGIASRAVVRVVGGVLTL